MRVSFSWPLPHPGRRGTWRAGFCDVFACTTKEGDDSSLPPAKECSLAVARLLHGSIPWHGPLLRGPMHARPGTQAPHAAAAHGLLLGEGGCVCARARVCVINPQHHLHCVSMCCIGCSDSVAYLLVSSPAHTTLCETLF